MCSELTTFKSVSTGTKKEKIPKVQHFSNKSPAKGEKMWKRRVRVKEGKGKRKNKSEIEVPKLRVLCKSLKYNNFFLKWKHTVFKLIKYCKHLGFAPFCLDGSTITYVASSCVNFWTSNIITLFTVEGKLIG